MRAADTAAANGEQFSRPGRKYGCVFEQFEKRFTTKLVHKLVLNNDVILLDPIWQSSFRVIFWKIWSNSDHLPPCRHQSPPSIRSQIVNGLCSDGVTYGSQPDFDWNHFIGVFNLPRVLGWFSRFSKHQNKQRVILMCFLLVRQSDGRNFSGIWTTLWID
jgi:hypothetical protein